MIREGAAWVVLKLRGALLWLMDGGTWAEDALFRLAQWIRGRAS